MLLLVSGIIGSSIFLTAKDIAGPLPNPILFFLVWVLGGVISLCACVAFAELGSMYPDSGGQYIYLREAYGDLVAFLYGWMLFAVANGGTIAALSVASAAYMGNIIPAISQRACASSSLFGMPFTRAHAVGLALIAILTYVNVVGLRWGALLQNVSTWTKFAAMAVFVVLGFAIGKGHWSNFTRADAGRAKHGTEPRTIDFRSRRRADRRVLGLRRLGLHHLGRRRSQRPAAQCAAGDGFGRARGGRDLSRHEHDLRLCPAAE